MGDADIRTSCDDEGFVGGHLVGEKFRAAWADDDHVLDMPMADMRLQRQHHAVFQHDVAAAPQDRICKMETNP